MTKVNAPSRFEARLLHPATSGGDDCWAFVVLPKNVSATLPRRGRTTVDGTVNGYAFQATLEPDGKRSHWLRLDQELLDAAGMHAGDVAMFEVTPVEREPEPEVPSDLQQALDVSPEALAGWNETTTIARLDWIHWITSAKQARTRAQRISNACSMLSSGKLRVCCFDSSGYYSKAFSAPKAAD
ncbi:YdeI/OmpD-associated family protein [Oxalicibacterium solurbis]|uniref:YdeI/OmpD-associated family protein n=1 Tax=Oxalicibacterium solurbis TaxID=69280 RepID=UPI001667E7B4|nr:YdeI/OmpD-associated family protein [Oxalicibacterium solurbis]